MLDDKGNLIKRQPIRDVAEIIITSLCVGSETKSWIRAIFHEIESRIEKLERLHDPGGPSIKPKPATDKDGMGEIRKKALFYAENFLPSQQFTGNAGFFTEIFDDTTIIQAWCIPRPRVASRSPAPA